MSRLIITLLLSLLLLNSCKKAVTPEPPPKQLTINDVHDVAIGNDALSYVEFSVALSSGNTEPVEAAVEGLPAGIEVETDLAGGTLTLIYYTALFRQTGIVAPGIYPIRIVASSPSCTAHAALNLIVHPLNGWSVDNKIYRRYQIKRGELLGAKLLDVTTNDAYATLSFQKVGDWPVADGTYNYRIGDAVSSAGVVSIEFSDQRQDSGASFVSNNADTTILSLVMHSGKASLSLAPTSITDGIISRSIAVSVQE